MSLLQGWASVHSFLIVKNRNIWFRNVLSCYTHGCPVHWQILNIKISKPAPMQGHLLMIERGLGSRSIQLFDTLSVSCEEQSIGDSDHKMYLPPRFHGRWKISLFWPVVPGKCVSHNSQCVCRTSAAVLHTPYHRWQHERMCSWDISQLGPRGHSWSSLCRASAQHCRNLLLVCSIKRFPSRGGLWGPGEIWFAWWHSVPA